MVVLLAARAHTSLQHFSSSLIFIRWWWTIGVRCWFDKIQDLCREQHYGNIRPFFGSSCPVPLPSLPQAVLCSMLKVPISWNEAQCWDQLDLSSGSLERVLGAHSWIFQLDQIGKIGPSYCWIGSSQQLKREQRQTWYFEPEWNGCKTLPETGISNVPNTAGCPFFYWMVSERFS